MHQADGELAGFDYDEAYRKLSERMRTLHISRISEMPRIELYMDQLLAIVTGELSFLQTPGETLVTGAMVNNYVKQRILPAPVKKRYTRRHIATLLFICTFKRAFPIAQIKEMRDALVACGLDAERSYDELCGALERTVAAQFPASRGTSDIPLLPDVRFLDEDGDERSAELAHLFGAGIVSVASKVYVEQMLVLAERSREAEAARASEGRTDGGDPKSR